MNWSIPDWWWECGNCGAELPASIMRCPDCVGLEDNAYVDPVYYTREVE